MTHLDPDLVLTTELVEADPAIAEVVTGSPSLNALDPLMKPEIVSSLLSFHLESVGTPRGALTDAVVFTVAVSALVSLVVAPPPNPNNEKVGRGADGLGGSSSCSFFGTATDFFAAAAAASRFA